MKRSLDPAEWLKKADSDLRTASAAWDEDPQELADSICYICQQAAEKYLKAFLISRGWQLKKTHDLESLLAEGILYEASLKSFDERLKIMHEDASDARYPADGADDLTEKDATDSLQTARDLAKAIKKFIPCDQIS